MKPSLFMRHFETKHGDLKQKPLEYSKESCPICQQVRAK
jgi:hypothetical protein